MLNVHREGVALSKANQVTDREIIDSEAVRRQRSTVAAARDASPPKSGTSRTP